MRKTSFLALDKYSEAERLDKGLSQMQDFESSEDNSELDHGFTLVSEQDLRKESQSLFSEEEMLLFPELREK